MRGVLPSMLTAVVVPNLSRLCRCQCACRAYQNSSSVQQ